MLSGSKQHSSFLAYIFSWAVVIVALIASSVSFFAPSIVNGLAVMVGSARGTALVILLIAVPILILSLFISQHRKSNGAKILWLGSLIYILYNSVMFLFAIPYNSLFFVYVLMFSLSFWSIFLLLPKFDTANFATSQTSKRSLRAISIYLLIIAAFFYFQELGQYIPALINNTIPTSYAGTGLLTNPSHVLDLGFVLPLIVVSAVWIWQRKPWGNILGGSLLVLLTVECVSIASDQYFGSLADPNSTVVSLAIVPLFAILALIGLIFSSLYFWAIKKIK